MAADYTIKRRWAKHLPTFLRLANRDMRLDDPGT